MIIPFTRLDLCCMVSVSHWVFHCDAYKTRALVGECEILCVVSVCVCVCGGGGGGGGAYKTRALVGECEILCVVSVCVCVCVGGGGMRNHHHSVNCCCLMGCLVEYTCIRH